ncbi:MAG: hypothetical protein MUF72_15715 [Elainella sp. Prado103]|jgi:hypothetical protein|nr:hypothetical protein [Elainella sp. Prado103]
MNSYSTISMTDEVTLAGLTTPTRNQFFYGKLMDVFHFQLETTYQNRKRWLLNRLNLGFGVVCGLTVVPTNDNQHVQVAAGVAIDKLGREMIVPVASPPIDPRQPTDAWGRPAGNPIADGESVHLCLAYHECETEPVPVLVGDCGREPTCAASLIKERYRILVKAGSAPPSNLTCQLPDLLASPLDSSNFHDQLSDRISQNCAEVTGETCIPIAQITLPATGEFITTDSINVKIRPLVYSQPLILETLLCLAQQIQTTPAPPAPLTKVQSISWTHDRPDLVTDINTFIDGGLTVAFSDNIQATTTQGRAWFIVTAEYPIGTPPEGSPMPQGTILVQRVLDQEITIEDNRAFFKPAPEFADTFSRTLGETGAIPPILCRVVLKCNYLTDTADPSQMVDGDFFGIDPVSENLRTGDGVPGGDFESWFFLTQ